MNSTRTPLTSRKRHGFSLIEIIVVVCIITIVITSAAPYVSGALAANKLRTAAEEVYSRLSDAQSLAILFNTDVEVRLYEAYDLIDETHRPTLRKLQILTLSPPDASDTLTSGQGVFEPVGAITSLDEEIEISQNAQHSSIVDLGFKGSIEDKLGRYIPVRFRSDGSPALHPASRWFLTLHERDAHLRGPKLKNFITIQIDPATGRLRTFQP